MGRVVHFEITADDPDRAAEFYRKVFNWEVADSGQPIPYMLVTTGPADKAGINGAITPRHEHLQAVVNTIDVDNWEQGAKAIVEAGGDILTKKTAITGIGYFAYCTDTELNIFGILEADPAAKAEDVLVAAGTASR